MRTFANLVRGQVQLSLRAPYMPYTSIRMFEREEDEYSY